MKSVQGLLVLVLSLLLLLTACGPDVRTDTTRPVTAILKAEVTDFITNTESRNNSTMYVWVRTDLNSAYCTLNKELFEKARALRERVVPVTIDYADINRQDAEYGSLGSANGSAGCDDYGHKGLVVYRLIDIHEAGNGEPLQETK